jgi:hypothetical protein
MTNASKKISPQALNQLKDTLSVIYWKKDQLRDFLKIVLTQNAILATLDWNGYKREVVNELIRRMIDRPDIYETDLFALFHAVADFEDYANLKYWDEDGSKTKKARESVARLRSLTKGYFQLAVEQDQSEKRKIEHEKTVSKTLSIQEELLALKLKFDEIALCKNYQKRGYMLEKFLYELFLLHDLEPKEGYKNNGEQIDGAFTFQHADYLLEAKWSKQVDRNDLADFCHKVDTKLKSALGLLVSIDGVTKYAIDPHFKSIIIMDGFDIISVLDGRITLSDLLFKKRRKAIETGEIYLNINQL